MVHGINHDETQKAAQKLGDDVGFVCYDLAKPDCGAVIVAAALDKFGTIDGLVNNAGIYPRSRIDSDIAQQFDPLFHINVRAPMLLMQAAVLHWRKMKKTGAIVNIGSINAHTGADSLFVYSATKAALMNTTRNLANALCAEGIRVNQLNIGWTLTEGEIAMQKTMGKPEDWMHNIPKVHAPRGSLLSPVDIAPHAVFWLSDYAIPVSGQVYEVEQYPVIGRLIDVG